MVSTLASARVKPIAAADAIGEHGEAARYQHRRGRRAIRIVRTSALAPGMSRTRSA
jgi:hypothetical protein